MKKGQMWSVDIIIGIVIFISIITVFYSTLSETSSDVWESLRASADTMIVKFTQDPNLRVIGDDNVLNDSKLSLIFNNSYEDVKKMLGIKGDFCIYLKDESGRLVPIGNKTSFGSPELNISGMPCGSVM